MLSALWIFIPNDACWGFEGRLFNLVIIGFRLLGLAGHGGSSFLAYTSSPFALIMGRFHVSLSGRFCSLEFTHDK